MLLLQNNVATSYKQLFTGVFKGNKVLQKNFIDSKTEK